MFLRLASAEASEIRKLSATMLADAWEQKISSRGRQQAKRKRDAQRAADEGRWETSDQRLWHALYEHVHELPFAYNANADANLTRGEWERVHVLHDLVVQRKRGWARSGHAPLVDELTREARRVMAAAALAPLRSE